MKLVQMADGAETVRRAIERLREALGLLGHGDRLPEALDCIKTVARDLAPFREDSPELARAWKQVAEASLFLSAPSNQESVAAGPGSDARLAAARDPLKLALRSLLAWLQRKG